MNITPMDQPLYVALLEAGVDEEKARAAAISVRTPNPLIAEGLTHNLVMARRVHFGLRMVFLAQCILCGLLFGQAVMKLWGAP